MFRAIFNFMRNTLFLLFEMVQVMNFNFAEINQLWYIFLVYTFVEIIFL
jgi:hypothetical protein